MRRRWAGCRARAVKAGLCLAGRPAGPVRPLLLELDERDLARLIEAARSAAILSARIAAEAATG
jgi:hypothetical protein